MSSKEQKKEQIRQDIILAAKIYSNELAGKSFLYVYGDEAFEVIYLTDRFLHLTGVESYLSAKDFYKKAKNGTLTADQFYFTPQHSMGKAKKKLPCLQRLPELTNTMICIVKDLTTLTLTYTIGVTNLEFTLGLTERDDEAGNTNKDIFVPRTLRVKDKAIDNSKDGDIVDFIFMKDASCGKYTNITFRDDYKTLPITIYGYLDLNAYKNGALQ